MTTWLVIMAVAVGSFVFRLAPLLLLEKSSPRPGVDRAIRDAGSAAITTLIVVSTVRASAGGTALPAMAAVGVGAVLAARRTPMLRILLAGGAVYAVAAVVADSIAALVSR
jgi:branched-subunit amino acid transport protein AzlD